RRRRQLTTQCERKLRRHSREKLELECRNVDAAREQLTASIQAVDLDELEILVDRRRRTLADAMADDVERTSVDVEQVLGDIQVSACGDQLTGFHPDVSP